VVRPNQLDAPPSAAPDILRGALLDSRQRWRDLVGMAADLVFETDEWGRFVFISPDPAMGWPAAMLLGQPGELLLDNGPLGGNAGPGDGFNPFRPCAPLRRRRGWLRRPDGTLACMVFAAAPLVDAEGRIIGARGLGMDLTEQEGQEAQVAAALRRGELLDHILWCMRQEVLAPRMMRAVLEAMVSALGAEGAAVIDAVGAGTTNGPVMLYQSGGGAGIVLPSAAELVSNGGDGPIQTHTPEGRPVLAAFTRTRFGEQIGLALWRTPGSRAWDTEDLALAGSSATIIRVVLEHESIQREMARQARTDPLTGLLNRRAFREEIIRHVDRLEREGHPGTLIYVDLDHFKQVNDRFGHEVGDIALRATADMLRELVRPTDLVARLGGDEFALWLNGADQFTAAERAEWLRLYGHTRLDEAVPNANPPLTLSLGIATRQPGSGEEIEAVMRRADTAMYEVKQNGRGHWRVAPPAGGGDVA
jgi:diguanylate cyclase (GGDEF)-like protein